MSDERDNRPVSDEAQESLQIPLTELIRTRYQKVRELRAKDINPYPYKYEWSHYIRDVLREFDALMTAQVRVRVAGRIMLKRKMGKVIFADVRDVSERIQIYVRKDDLGEESFAVFNSLDMGDIIGCEGYVFVTKTGERTIHVESYELLSKALHPLPDKHAGLTDVETRYRRRYADLIVNPEVREVFRMRSRVIQTVRDFINGEGFLEVETPILQPLYGGASARPFITHHHRLDIPMYLRIADELYLKRLIVGGFDKVWEFCKDFRNEGLDRFHNPEFSMIELYWAYADYRDIAKLFERLVRHTVKETCGSYTVTYGEHEIDFGRPFRWVTMVDSIKEATGVDFTNFTYEEAVAAAKALQVDTTDLHNRGKVIEGVWEAKVEPTLIQPTFIADHPVEISPLAKKHKTDPRFVERFELFVAGGELGNAFSELNDPVDQLQRFLEQGKAIDAGDEEAQPLDDDFITALAYGMPPTGGLGFGIDRLVMLLTNQHSIRDVLFFPQMKDTKEGTVPVSRILMQLVEEEGAD
ncbi:MAG: lysine--tRNA ligase [candidate division Zixibacteria bacterium]|jgi:lysyl-tRNA synthetase class 2|nr:lysine--tRNA ligase [candidate division Zixibacteria bacterium]